MIPPRDPWYRTGYNRYRDYGDRPYRGCGCIYPILMILLIWIVVSFLCRGSLWVPGYY